MVYFLAEVRGLYGKELSYMSLLHANNLIKKVNTKYNSTKGLEKFLDVFLKGAINVNNKKVIDEWLTYNNTEKGVIVYKNPKFERHQKTIQPKNKEEFEDFMFGKSNQLYDLVGIKETDKIKSTVDKSIKNMISDYGFQAFINHLAETKSYNLKPEDKNYNKWTGIAKRSSQILDMYHKKTIEELIFEDVEKTVNSSIMYLVRKNI